MRILMVWFVTAICSVLLSDCGKDPTSADIVTEEDIPALTKALEDPKADAGWRGRAAGRLGQTRSVKAIKPLVKAALDEKNPTSVRIVCIDALLEIGDPSVIPELVKMATDKDAKLRVRVMLALSYFKGKKQEIESTLLAGLKDSDELVRKEALNSLDKLGILPPLAELEQLLNDPSPAIPEMAAVMVYKKREEEGASKIIMKGLENKQVGVLKHMIVAAGEIGLQDAVPKLIELTKRNEMVLREESAKALGKLHAMSAVKALIDLLQDPVVDVAAAAVEALGKLGGPEVVDNLIQMLEHSDDNVRMIALKALVEMKCNDERFIKRLEYLSAREPHKDIRDLADQTLRELGLKKDEGGE